MSMMNAAFRCTARAAAGQHRSMSTASSPTFLVARESWSFRKNWLSDPATYPLLIVMAGAGFLVVGVATSCLRNSPDVRISKTRRSSVLRTWGFNY